MLKWNGILRPVRNVFRRAWILLHKGPRLHRWRPGNDSIECDCCTSVATWLWWGRAFCSVCFDKRFPGARSRLWRAGEGI